MAADHGTPRIRVFVAILCEVAQAEAPGLLFVVSSNKAISVGAAVAAGVA